MDIIRRKLILVTLELKGLKRSRRYGFHHMYGNPQQSWILYSMLWILTSR